jgi:hypothetical protein
VSGGAPLPRRAAGVRPAPPGPAAADLGDSTGGGAPQGGELRLDDLDQLVQRRYRIPIGVEPQCMPPL